MTYSGEKEKPAVIFRKACLAILSLAFALGSALATEDILLKRGESSFRVSTAEKGRIHVYVLGSREPLPDELSISLFRSGSMIDEIALSALPKASAAEPPVFAGSLNPNASSFTGLQLKIRYKKNKKQTVLDWKG